MSLDKTKISEYLLYISTAFAPFYILLPTNISVYEVFVFLAFLLIVIDNSIRLPNIHLLTGLFLLLIGYTLSIVNAGDSTSVNIILQLPIIIIQSITLYSLVRTNKHLWYHCVAFTVPLIIIVISYILLYMGIYTHIELFAQTGSAYVHAGRLGLFYYNPNIFALIIAMVLPCAAFIYYYSNNSIVKISYAIFIAISVIILIETGSRRVFLFSLLIILLIFILYADRNKNKIVYFKHILASLIISTIFIIAARSIFESTIIPERVSETISGNMDIDRFEAWSSGIRESITSPLFGVGYRQTSYYSVSNPHNIILNPLVEGGIFAALGAVYIVFYLLRIGLYASANRIEYYFGIPFIIASILYIATAQFAQLYAFRFVWLCIIMSYITYDLSSNRIT